MPKAFKKGMDLFIEPIVIGKEIFVLTGWLLMVYLMNLESAFTRTP